MNYRTEQKSGYKEQTWPALSCSLVSNSMFVPIFINLNKALHYKLFPLRPYQSNYGSDEKLLKGHLSKALHSEL